MLYKSAFLALSLAAPFAWGASLATETFDSDNGVFIPNTTASTVAFAAAGGNPAGHILVRRNLGAQFFDIGALTSDSRFTGNYAADGITGVNVDLNFQTDNFTNAWFRVRIDSVSNGWLLPLTAAFPQNTWTTYAAAFDPTWTDLQARAAGWVTDQDVSGTPLASPSFATVMASVGTAEIRLATTNASSLAGIDNFGLTTVPEPSSFALLGGALALAALRKRRF